MLAGLYAFGATLAITIAHLSVIRLRFTMPDQERPFSIPVSIGFRSGSLPLPAVAGALLGFLALVSVLVYHDSARWVGGAWLLFGLAAYAVYRLVFEQVGTEPARDRRSALADQAAPEGRPERGSSCRSSAPPLDEDIVSTAGLLAVNPRPDGNGGGAQLVILYTIEVPLSLGIDDPLPEGVEEEAERVGREGRD